MLLNPYKAGNPLKDKDFFYGREDIVREVMQMLRHPDEKAIVIYGQRRIGKTSILFQLNKRLEEECRYTPVFFDLMDRASASLPEVIYKLAQVVAARLHQPPPNPALFDEDGEYFKSQFLPQITQSACSEGLAILFDEFDVMDTPKEGQAGQAFFPYLRRCLDELQRVKFIFVIGRRPEELSTNTLATFKGVRAARVSALDRRSTEQVIRQSEANGRLCWSQAAVDRVWALTEGHAFFTQLLGSVTWENLIEAAEDNPPPTVQPGDVDQAVPESLRHGASAFAWIWDGLPPAERVIMAAVAEGPEEVIHPDEIESILNRSGVRLIVNQLRLAPATLVDWEVLRPVDGGYRFAVPLMRRWIKANRPLSRVKEELDRIDPLAETLFRAGQSFYSLNKKEEALQQLHQALTVNPNHVKSRLLLGRISLEQGSADAIRQAVVTLEEAYQYDPSAALPDLTRSLLAQAELEPDAEKRLPFYERILVLYPGQPIAAERRAVIWRARGEAALSGGDYGAAREAFTAAGDTAGILRAAQAEKQSWIQIGEEALERREYPRALEAFEKAGDHARVEKVTFEQSQLWMKQGEQCLAANELDKAEEWFKLARQADRVQAVRQLREERWLADMLKTCQVAESREDWEQAAGLYRKILERHPDHPEALAKLAVANKEADLFKRYQTAVDLAEDLQPQEAQRIFAQIVAERPAYKRAARYLSEIVDGRYGPASSRRKTDKFFESIGAGCVYSLVWLVSLVVFAVVFTIIWGIIYFSNQSSPTPQWIFILLYVFAGFSLILASWFTYVLITRGRQRRKTRKPRSVSLPPVPSGEATGQVEQDTSPQHINTEKTTEQGMQK